MAKSSVLRSVFFYGASGGAFLLVLHLASTLGANFGAEPVVDFTTGQQKALDIFFSMDQQLTTLATLSIGGVAAFVFQRYSNRSVPKAQVLRAMLSWMFSGLSLLCGFLTYQRVEYMLDNHFFDLRSSLVTWPSRLQFITFGLSLIVFADFVLQALQDIPPNAGK
jgi:hypothetical protein